MVAFYLKIKYFSFLVLYLSLNFFISSFKIALVDNLAQLFISYWFFSGHLSF
jgi:hypothetical protein